MIAYLIKSGLCLAILLAFYHLVLEKEKMHQFNRFYLLGSVLFAFLVPFAIIYVDVEPEVLQEASLLVLSKDQPIISEPPQIAESISWSQYLLIAYIFVSLLLLIRFCKSLMDILLKIQNNTIVSYKKAKLVLVNDPILPHTFWNYIFINKEEYESKTVEKELFTHELTHVTQRHTLDVLIVEILQIVLWFNPFFYPLKKAIQLNHEFIADDKVIASHNDIPKYQYLLLDKAAWKNKYYLASNLNYSLTKKRLLMMKTPNSKSTLLWKKLAIAPLLGGLFFLFADRVEAQTKKKKPEIIEIKKSVQEATDAQMKEYRVLLQESSKKKIYRMTDVKRMRYIRSLMSEEQKNTTTDINEILPPLPPPAKSMNKKISSKKYNELKNKEKFAVWIDGKHVDNKELNKYKASYFASHSGSFIYKNARSKKFPQEYQFHLYTQSYIDKLQEEYEINQKRIPPPTPVKIEVIEEKEIKNIPPPQPPAKATKKQKQAYQEALIVYEKRAKELQEEKEAYKKVLKQYEKREKTLKERAKKEIFREIEIKEQKKKAKQKLDELKERKILIEKKKKLKNKKKAIKDKKVSKIVIEKKGDKEIKEIIEVLEKTEVPVSIQVEKIAKENADTDEEIEIVIKEKPTKKTSKGWDDFGKKIGNPEEEEEEVRVEKIIPFDWDNFEEVSKNPQQQKSIFRVRGLKGIPNKNISYYINGKKVSKKKADKLMKKNPDKIKTINVIKYDDGKKAKVEITK